MRTFTQSIKAQTKESLHFLGDSTTPLAEKEKHFHKICRLADVLLKYKNIHRNNKNFTQKQILDCFPIDNPLVNHYRKYVK